MDMQGLVTEKDYTDAINLCKARAYHYQSIGWTQFAREDLISAGYEGICIAAQRFDPSKGTVKATKFTSYAYFWIEKYIREFIAKNKSIVSGSLSDCWCGRVPYAQSIDQYTNDNDSAGPDHNAWLSDHSNACSTIEQNELRQQQADLLAEMFSELHEIERTVLMLRMGIGTIDSQPLTIRDLAEAMDMSIGKVHSIVRAAQAKFDMIKTKYHQRANQLFEA